MTWDPETLASIPPVEVRGLAGRIVVGCVLVVVLALVVTTSWSQSNAIIRIEEAQRRLNERIAVVENETKHQRELIDKAIDLTELGRLILERERAKAVTK